MKTLILTAILIVPLTTLATAPDWSKPQIECVEDIVPKVPDEPCLDLTTVADPIKDFPAHFSEEQIADWKKKRRILTYCRYQEVVRREQIRPGSQSPDAIKVAWMLQSAIDTRDLKISAVYRASRDYKIPFTVLAGAIRQESLFASLGISPDGNNYSCSIAQFNIVGWCLWLNTQPASLQQQLGWPKALNCSELTAPMMKPFYDIAVTRLPPSVPVYKMDWEQFKDISFNQVRSSLGSGTEQQLATRYQAAMSFAKNCANPLYGIHAKANEIARIYREHVPAGLKQVQQYKTGEAWPIQCIERGYEGAYPFQPGWLLAVGMYNAGPRILNVLSHYWGWKSSALSNPATFKNVAATELVEGLYWGGRFDKPKDQVVFSTLSGGSSSISWYKMCVVQRHVARIVQNSTKTGTVAPVDSLEGANVCAPASRDPNGNIISSAPASRQNSSGVKATSLIQMLMSYFN